MIGAWRKVYPAEGIRTAVFFGLFFMYLWLWVQPCLIHSCGTITNFPVFYKGWAFFRGSTPYPGGLIGYISAFLSQLFEYSWAGAAVITAQAWTLSACTGYFLRSVGLPGARLLRFVPVILVLMAYAQYSYHFSLFMGALASLAFACLYVALTGRSRILAQESEAHGNRAGWRDLVVYLVLTVALYVVGAGAFLPFAAMCAAYELRNRRWLRIGLYLLIGAVLPYVVGVLVFRVSLANAYTELLPVSWRVLGWPAREKMVATAYAVYLFPILGALVGSVPVRAYPGFVEDNASQPPRSRGQAHYKRGRILGPRVRWMLGSLVLFAAGGVAAVLCLDGREKALLQVHYYACRRMWPQVLTAARRCPDSHYAMNAVNRALYHGGRLNRDMFLYPQNPNNLLATGADHVLWYWHAFDTLIDLGLMNLAEKNLTECLETFGEHPLILERLAMINMAKGRTEAARIYLGALQKTLFHGRWASDYLTRLDADPNLSGDPQIRRLRAQGLRKDYTAQFFSKDMMLAALVEPDGSNRMAFEYQMAWHLLTGQLAKIVQQVERLRDFGYPEIPPLYQEAILIYVYGTRQPVDLHGMAIDPQLRQRIEHFSSVVNRYGGNRDAVAAELAKDYRGTYFFYYFCTVLAKRR